MLGYLFLFLLCVAFIAYFIYDYDQNSDYFNFLIETKFGDWLVEYEFVYFMICFFGTAIPATGVIYFFIKFVLALGAKIN